MDLSLPNLPITSWQEKISCQIIHNNLQLDRTHLKTSVNSYVYALFEQGTAKIKFDKYEITAHPGDLLIFPPHIYPTILQASDDYEVIFLIVSQSFVYDCPLARSVYQTSTFSLLHDDNPIIKLPEVAQKTLHEIMMQIMDHINYGHSYTAEALQALYALLLADIMAVIDQFNNDKKISQSAYHVFIEFNKLLRHHFREHHDIAFYADQLKISPRYLSMVTKKISHLTVASYINRHLMLEACWLLKTTDHSIQHISELLHFADQASFSKFFKRLNGQNPLHYRHEQEPDILGPKSK
ncbi:MAG: helix-turn-helix transcriptional regulator [Prevotella sp.]|nr:helix-turn-helix transcriptional regulator [Prevotella sp.]